MKPNIFFQTNNEFSIFIEKKAIEENIPCYQALLDFCEENEIDPEEITKYINQSLKDKIEVEFSQIGLLKGKNKLDV